MGTVTNDITSNRICDICGKPTTIDMSNVSEGIPSFNKHSAICSKCSSKGWRHCDECEKPYDIHNTHFEDFNVIFPMVSTYKTYRPYRFCSNECYNLEYLEYEKSHFNNIIVEIEVLGLHSDKTEEERKSMISYAIRNLEKINSLIGDLKKL